MDETKFEPLDRRSGGSGSRMSRPGKELGKEPDLTGGGSSFEIT